jgi:hypothetical protein
MMEIAVALLAFWSYCAVMSVAARSERGWVTLAGVHAGSVAVFVALFCWATWAVVTRMTPFLGMPFVVLTAIVGVLLGLRWWSFLVGEYFDRSRAAAIGMDRMKVEKSYDAAAKAEREGRWADAERAYLDEAAADPTDAEAMRRAGEALVRAGRVEEGARHLQTALTRLKEREARANLAFRIAELLARDLGKRDDARRVLESIVLELEGSKYREYAQARLKSLSVT